MLIAHAETLARDAGCTTMRIEAVKEAGLMPFYERRGYRVTASTSGRCGTAARTGARPSTWHMVDMEKALS